jgi:hypothetical protein
MAICWAFSAGAQETPTLAATLNRTSFSINSTATFAITVNGARSADIKLPEIEDLVFHKRGQSSQLQMINGSFSSSITFNYIIQARKAGNYTIPAIQVNAAGHLLQTEPMSIEVSADQTSPDGNSSTPSPGSIQDQAEVAFVRLNALKDKVYTGEIIPVEIKAYFQNGLRVEIHKLPAPNGEAFIMSPLDDEPEQTTETINGRGYSVIIWQTAISPVKEGEYDLFIDLNATLLFPQRNTGSLFNDPFFNDDFFSGFFGGFQRKTVTLATPKQAITILPLPQEGKPENFSGAIGDFALDVSAKPTAIKPGDPITLTIKIRGKGNFDRVTAPPFPNSESWKTYSPSSRFINSGTNYEGEKLFEQAVVARDSTVKAIPPLTFNYFDPHKNSYVSTTSQPVAITFTTDDSGQPEPQQKSSPPPQVVPDRQENLTRLPLAAPRLQAGTFVPRIQPVFLRLWYIVTLVCCSLTLLLVFCLLLRNSYLKKHQPRFEKKKLSRIIEKKFAGLQRAIQEANEDAFLHECRDIMQIRLGVLWQITPSAITLIDLQKRLPPHSPLLHIFAAVEQHTYGSGRLSADDMKEYYQLLKKELEELR